MQIFVNTFTGNKISIDVSGSDLVDQVRQEIQSREGIISQCRLHFGSQLLQDGFSLNHYQIPGYSTLDLNVELLGGGKKRKKKVYKTQKRIPHKNKKVKLTILKFYKVDEDNNVLRLREECPAPTCGAGVFMANHADRTYCGRCGLTNFFLKA